MATLRESVSRIRAALRPNRQDRELEEELRLHVELIAETERSRHRPESATRTAAIRAGGIAQTMEALRDQRGLPWLDDLVRDMRHALRLLRRDPAFAAVAVLSLAIGIGANSAIFSFADEVILRPLAIRDPGAVVTVSADLTDQGSANGRVSYLNYRDLRDHSQSFEGLLGFQNSRISFARSRQDTREMRIGTLVTDNFFSVLGIQPALGRVFAPQEAQAPGRDAVVVLSYDFWKNELAADTAILNDVVWINGVAFHVVGVAAPGFSGPEPPLQPSFYVPIMMAQRLGAAAVNPLEQRETRLLALKGRLKPGVSLAGARAEMTILWQALERQYPDANRNRTIAVRTEVEERVRQDPEDTVLLALLAALAALVLVIACANVANLMLSRARGRAREMAIRLAMGVSRSRLLRQLMAESLVLTAASCAIGLVFAYGAIRFLRTIPTSDQVVIAPRLDQRVLMFSVLAAAVSAVLFGLAPARQCLKTALVPALKTSEPDDTRRRRAVGRHLLVGGQVALSLVLLIATGMLLDGFFKATALNPGFRTDHLMMMSLDTSLVRYTPAQTRAFYRALVDRAHALPDVVSATLTSAVPFQELGQGTKAVIPEGYSFPRGQGSTSMFAAEVDEHYFGTMHIDVIRGRGFTADDRDGSRRVAVVNEQLAKTYWPKQDAIGKRLRLADGDGAWLEVVGVTTTGKYTWIGERPMPFLYLPFAQQDKTSMSLVVETTNSDPARLSAPLRDVVRALDVNQPVFDMQTVASLYERHDLAVLAMLMQMVGTLCLLGLILALIGLYGLVAYSVARRTREIGIRMAIGATKADVLRMILRQGLLLSIAGIAAGGVASVAVARVLSATLVGLGRPNPATYVIVPVALVCLTMAASYFPARRASLVDPLVALRYE